MCTGTKFCHQYIGQSNPSTQLVKRLKVKNLEKIIHFEAYVKTLNLHMS